MPIPCDPDISTTCPRRAEGPAFDVTFADRWEKDRWGEEARRRNQREDDQFKAEHPNVVIHESPNLYRWDGPGAPPRTCSYCGGAHPEDAIKLVAAGWKAEATGKGYKFYLHPPGYIEACRSAVRSGLLAGCWTPTPPLKVYLQHFTPEQTSRLLEAERQACASEKDGNQ